MKRFWPRRYRKSLFRLSPFSAVLVFILSWSCKTAMVDFRGFTGSGLVIEQTKISPAWAAYEDSQSQWQSEFTSEKVNEEWGESLVSGIGPYTPEEMDGWRYGSSSLDGKRGESQIPDVYREGRLKGMVISQIAPGDTNGNPQGTLVAQVSPTSLPQVDLAGLQTEGELSFEERAQQLVAAELERRRKSENIRYIEGTRGEALKVVGSNRVNRDQGLFSSWVAPEESVSPSDGRKTFSPSQNLAKGTPHTKPGTSVQGNLDLEIEDRSIPFVLSGSFGITGGLAYVEGSMRFELIQYLFDVPLARGVIWENDARFEIAVKELRGDLELRLVDTDGRVLGSGRLQLHQLNVSPRNEMKIEDLEIILAPAPLGARIEVVSAYSIGTHSSLPVAKAKVEIQGLNRSYRTDEEGLVSDPDFLPGSNFILKVEKKDFWGSLVFGLSGETLRVPLFPNKMVSALLSLIARNDFEENEFREGSIVWGKVTQDGLPLEGAVVELAGPEELTPSYFNIAYLPDVSLKSTGTNGLFVFVGVNPGIQSVRVRLGEKVFPAKIIPTEKGFVSHLELDVGKSAGTLVRVSSAPKRQEPGSAFFRLVGAEEDVVRIDGEAKIDWPQGNRTTLVEAQATEGSETLRFSLDSQKSSVLVPLLDSDWLLQMAVGKKVNIQGGKGVVVGFVNGKDFEVFVDEREPYETENIVYFDASGNILRQGHGVAGGGFILFNVPLGFHSVMAIPQGSDRIWSRTLVSESSLTNLIPEVNL